MQHDLVTMRTAAQALVEVLALVPNLSVPILRGDTMIWNIEISKASKIVQHLDHSTESRTISSLEELDALIHELGDRVIIDIPDGDEVSLTVYDDYLE